MHRLRRLRPRLLTLDLHSTAFLRDLCALCGPTLLLASFRVIRGQNSHRRTIPAATPISTSPIRLHGEVFFLFNASTSLLCVSITLSFAATVSFFALSAFRRASLSAFCVAVNSKSREVVCFSVESLSLRSAVSLSSNSISFRDAFNSLTAAEHAFRVRDSSRCGLPPCSARISEFSELSAEFGCVCADWPDTLCTLNIPASITNITTDLLKFFILFPR